MKIKTTRFYYCGDDDLSVQCVDEIDSYTTVSGQGVAYLAEYYPENIYFGVEVTS